MKRGLKILAIMLATFISLTYVKADETNYITTAGRWENLNIEKFSKAYEIIQQNSYDYYFIQIASSPQGELYSYYNLYLFNDSDDDFGYTCDQGSYTCLWTGYETGKEIEINWTTLETEETVNDTMMFFGYGKYLLYDTNYNFKSPYNFELRGFYQDNIVIEQNSSTIPSYKDLLQYNSWSEYENEHLDGYSEVNLDNYEYVLLTLKDYNQTQAFQTNLQVKGQIGITPIYNYGQSSKDSITGSQVQDRCNVSYSSYTSYPFYVLQSDLQNNVVYAVKECSSGSSFKYDTNIFDITYITSENADNPTVTIGGKTYNVIPYNDLPSTATKNEEDNYIPGQSGSAVDSGGIDSAIKGVQQGLSTLWNTFTYFTDLVGLIFSSLPVELRTILLSAFVVAITIGLIKLFTN